MFVQLNMLCLGNRPHAPLRKKCVGSSCIFHPTREKYRGSCHGGCITEVHGGRITDGHIDHITEGTYIYTVMMVALQRVTGSYYTGSRWSYYRGP